jgi:putative oxidoreductase
MLIVLRIAIGLLFVVSGAEKLISPYQNFLYVIQAYQVLPGWAEELTARIFPWIELFAGLFMVLGLWTSWALKSVLLMTAVFITIVGQALLRGLPLDQCGCFGELLHVPPQIIVVFDSFILLLTVMLWRHINRTNQFSLDQYFSK